MRRKRATKGMRVQSRARIHLQDSDGETPLHCCAHADSEEEDIISCSVARLLDAGAVTNASNEEGRTPLHVASVHANCKIMRQLLDNATNRASVNARDKCGRVPLFYAADDIDATRLLIDFGADVNARDHLGVAPLHVAATNPTIDGRFSTVRLLLDAGADTRAADSADVTALHLACGLGRVDLAKMLIERGADINANGEAATPLHFAAEEGRVGCIRLLVKCGADLRAKRPRNGRTALHDAVRSKHKRASTQLLIKSGADANATDDNDEPPMHMLLCQHQEERMFNTVGEAMAYTLGNDDSNEAAIDTVQLLLKNGADINAVNLSGFTPMFAMYVSMLCRDPTVTGEYDAEDVHEDYNEKVHIDTNSGTHTFTLLCI